MYEGDFTDVFGGFEAVGAGDKQYRPNIITTIDDGRANPCNTCGKYPRMHDAYFTDKVKYPKHFYMSCGTCDKCDGEWYATEDEAIKAWNLQNPLTKVEVDEARAAQVKFAKDIVEGMRCNW